MRPDEDAFDRAQRSYWTDRTNVRSHDHAVVRAFAGQRIGFIGGLLAATRPVSALEIGCGDGFGMSAMAELLPEVHGCDVSPAMLGANPAPRNRLAQASAYALPFAGDAFDLVYCWELLHHLGDPAAAVREMARVARRVVLVCEPNCLNPLMAGFGVLAAHERGLLRFTPGFVRRLLVQAGLQDVRVQSVGCFTPNRTPGWLVALLRRLPYRWPVVGLYHVAVGRVPVGRSSPRPAALVPS